MKLPICLPLALLALCPLLAACGEAIPAEIRTVDTPRPILLPAFDEMGFVARDPETDRPLHEIAEEMGHPASLEPLFAPDGTVRRCPDTGLPIWSLDGDLVRHACDCGR